MGSMFKLVNEINTSKTEWAMKLRLIRSYRVPAVPNRRAETHECVFHDMEGERIHATINADQLNRISPLLSEGKLYAVKNFLVTYNKSKYRTTSNRKLVIFLQKTKVIEIIDEKFPKLLYNFKSFDYLSDIENLNEAEMFDVIGRLRSINRPKVITSTGGEMKLMEIVLEDTQRTQMHCTLWEEYAEQIEAYVRSAGQEPPIIIVQFCRGKIFNDRVVLSSTYNATKLGFNVECPEVEEFKQGFDDDDDATAPINLSNSVSIASASTTAEDSSIQNMNIKTIVQLTQHGEVGSFWVLARIVSIETFGQWWYLSCRVCKRKLLKEKEQFKCEGCKKLVSSGTPRYKIHVRVQDGSDNAIFTLWDQQCVILIGKTVTQVLEDDHNKNDSLIPDALYRMINAQALFYVQVKPEQITGYSETYSVSKITKDQNLIRKFIGTESQETDQISRLHRDGIDSLKEESSENEFTTPQKKMKKQEITECIEVAGLKRKLIDEFSTTKAEKKKAIMTKQEEEDDYEQV